MEVSSRRVLLRHLEPARPLRRCVHVDVEPQINATAGEQPLVEQETTVGIEQFMKIFNLHKQTKAALKPRRGQNTYQTTPLCYLRLGIQGNKS
ncbi:uncharacterized protein C8orf88 homolog isoform 4-T8 [Anableps anableps]